MEQIATFKNSLGGDLVPKTKVVDMLLDLRGTVVPASEIDARLANLGAQSLCSRAAVEELLDELANLAAAEALV